LACRAINAKVVQRGETRQEERARGAGFFVKNGRREIAGRVEISPEESLGRLASAFLLPLPLESESLESAIRSHCFFASHNRFILLATFAPNCRAQRAARYGAQLREERASFTKERCRFKRIPSGMTRARGGE